MSSADFGWQAASSPDRKGTMRSNTDSLRKWVAGYSVRGAAGVVAKRRSSNYILEFKLEVLRRMKEDGISWR
jgi:hypothetical protein